MKTVIKFICSFICYVLLVPCLLALTIGATWYLLPACQTTWLGQWLLTNVTEQGIFIATIVSGVTTIFFWIMGKVFVVIKNSKALNFYTHLVSWILALVLAAEAVYAFIASDAIQSAALELNLVRKIGLLACAVAMLLYAIIAPKVRKLVDRKIFGGIRSYYGYIIAHLIILQVSNK